MKDEGENIVWSTGRLVGVHKRTKRMWRILLNINVAIQNGLLYAISKFARFMLDFGLVYVIESPIFEQGGKYFYPSDPRIPGTQFCVGMDPSKHYRRFKGWTSLCLVPVYRNIYLRIVL